APANGAIISGSVGIGTPSPLSALDVAGGVAIGSYAGANAAPANGAIISGNLGIGTNGPSALVHIGAGTSNSGHLRMDGIAGNPGTPTDGDHWYNTTQKSHRFRETTGTAGLVGLLYANTAVSNAVSNTTTETNFNTAYTLPANSLTAGKVIRILASGTIGWSTGNIILRVKLGTTNILATATLTPTAGPYLWHTEANITCLTTGNPGTVEGQGITLLATSATDGVQAQMINTASVSVDTTASQTVQLSAKWGTANASNTITLRQITIEAMD
ncbi:MAG: hypothetical protein WCW52_11955, partial [Elusimicrobiales bacterium]